jgi:hypothetical protein
MIDPRVPRTQSFRFLFSSAFCRFCNILRNAIYKGSLSCRRKNGKAYCMYIFIPQPINMFQRLTAFESFRQQQQPKKIIANMYIEKKNSAKDVMQRRERNQKEEKKNHPK